MHNGIIENHETLREQLQALGYEFVSQTDTEVIAHLIHHERKTHDDLLDALKAAVRQLEGAYGTVVMDTNDPERLVVARSGSPLAIGVGIGENFVASDQLALLPVTRNLFISKKVTLPISTVTTSKFMIALTKLLSAKSLIQMSITMQAVKVSIAISC